MEHTKGKWKISDLSDNTRAVVETDKTLICTTVGDIPHLANARLIVSAPDLLEACEELLIYINADNETKVLMYPESIELAKKAINKARGGK